VVLGTAAVICLAVGAVSVQQAVALGLPAVILIMGGLIAAAIPDPATGRRAGFQTGFRTGFRVGSLLSQWRSVFRQRRN